MKNNKAVTAIVKDFIKDLSVRELLELLPVDSEIKERLSTKTDHRRGKNFRVVNLPNLNAQSEFDELMETFKEVHFLTEITSTTKTIIIDEN